MLLSHHKNTIRSAPSLILHKNINPTHFGYLIDVMFMNEEGAIDKGMDVEGADTEPIGAERRSEPIVSASWGFVVGCPLFAPLS